MSMSFQWKHAAVGLCVALCLLVCDAQWGETFFNPLKEVQKAGNELKRAISGSGAEWYSIYRKARKAARKGEWETAAELFENAIEEGDKPKTWTNRDGSEGTYYPYLHLGMVYLVTGDFDAARQYCTLSDEKAVAPEPAVKKCLAFVNEHKTQQPAATTVSLPASSPVVDSKALNPPGQVQTRQISKPAQRQGETYAVIIGIGTFQDNRIPALRYPTNDARGFYDVLTNPQYGGVPEDHVTLLLNEEAKTRNIKSAIGKWLKSKARKEDTVIIFYTGHGAPEGQETYWVTYDADIDDLFSTALDNNTITDMLARVDAQRMITFLDSCYSAATVNRTNRTRDIQVEIPWDKFTGEGNVIISASNGKQLSLEMQAYEHGVFTYYLLEGLKGQADGMTGEGRDGVIEVEEIWNYVRNRVSETARAQNNTQTPVLQGSLTAGIPLTYDRKFLREMTQKRQRIRQERQQTLQTLFEQGKLPADQFDCAFRMVETDQTNGYLDGLFSGEISPGTFRKLFKCE